jgi:N-acetylneuraminate synthase
MPSNPLIVAEIGINHNGSVEIAKQLIDMAVDCGCDAVKFQKRTIPIVYSPEELAWPRESPWGTTNGDQKRGLEFGQDEYDEIDAYCLQQGIDWFASAWDLESLHFLRGYNLKYNKVASAMVTNEEFLRVVAAEQRETFVSTGMTTLRQIERAASIFREARCPFVLMHTVSTYPTPDHDLNLRCIQALRQIHPRVGYSGHEVSPLPSIIAAALGAEVIERHVTLDRSMYGSDQAASLERRGLETMVDGIRRVPLYLGTGVKIITPGEQDVAKKLRYFEEAA